MVEIKSSYAGIGDNAVFFPYIDWNIRFFGAHIQTVAPDLCIPRESHHGFEILVILDGEQETTIQNNRYIVRKDDILLIPPGFEHASRCISPDSMTYFCAHFDIDEPSLRMKIMKIATGFTNLPVFFTTE